MFIYSTLRSVIEKPPVARKEILPLTIHQLAGFRLHPGPVRIFISCMHVTGNMDNIGIKCIITKHFEFC